MSLHAPYLDAIQALPGDTPGEKYRWIATQINERASISNDLEEILAYEKFPRALAPLIQVEGVRLRMKAIKRGLATENKRSISNYEAIAEALKSEDSEVVNRALQVQEFFDGTNPTITNVTFFFDELFPMVSLKTRQKIIKVLGRRLSKNPSLAEEFFSRMLATYGMDQALLLLPACSEDFILDVVRQRKLRLPRKVVKLIYAKNPELVVRYLKMLGPKSPNNKMTIHDYNDFLGRLIKKRLQAFTEIYEMHEECPVTLNLSKTCAEAFWKNGKECLERKPRLYVGLLPLKIINEAGMERIFAGILPEKLKDFSTDNALKYLEFYPEEKKADLLLDSYRKVYGRNLLDDPNNITPELLKALPADERIQQARKLIEIKHNPTYPMNYQYVWRCYLPAAESVPEMKEEIARTPEMEDRAAMLCQMIYTCKVNRDDDALYPVLKYWRDRHKNEQPWFNMRILQFLEEVFKLPDCDETFWTIVLEVIKRMYVKDQFTYCHGTTNDIFMDALRYKLKNNLPIEPVIELFVDIKMKGYYRTWNMLDENPEYEKKCFEACLAVVQRKCEAGKGLWKTEKNDILVNMVESVYNYNDRHITRNPKITVEPLSIRNYAWLFKEIEALLAKPKALQDYTVNSFKRIFAKYEPELRARFWPADEAQIASVDSMEALAQLRKDPKSILDEWEKYLEACRESFRIKLVQRFVRTSRWYKELPIKWAEQCARDIKEEKCPDSINILGLLLHGHSFTKFLDPLIPVGQSIDINHEDAKADFGLAYSAITSMKISNPPVPLELVNRMCTTDYLSYALMALNNVCRRTCFPKVINFARSLSNQRVSVRKHGIRLVHLVAPLQEVSDFLLTLWKTEEHYSIRQVIFAKASDIFRRQPGPISWSVLAEIISGLALKDMALFVDLVSLVRNTPEEYLERVLKHAFALVDRLEKEGLPLESVISYTSDLISTIETDACDGMSEEFARALLRKFLFHQEKEIARPARYAVVHYYLECEGPKLEQRLRGLAAIFGQVVAAEWNLPHPKHPRYFPVNHAVHEFIKDLTTCRNDRERDLRIIQVFRDSFNSLLKPQMDPNSYLLLAFASERREGQKAKEFGASIARAIPKLVDVFTPYFMGSISGAFDSYFWTLSFENLENEEMRLSVIEGILEVDTTEALLLATKLLTPVTRAQNFDRHDAIVASLSKSEHPAIKSLLCDFVNNTSPSNC